jgi:hypothetical protein
LKRDNSNHSENARRYKKFGLEDNSGKVLGGV